MTKEPVSYRSFSRKNLDVNGVNLFTRDTQVGKKNMLCLHGRWGRGETWAALIERYRDRYRTIAPDQRGHGLSGKPVCRYSADVQADDARGLLVKLQAAPAVVIGHSMGGRVGAYLAAAHPEVVSALVLIDIGPACPHAASDIEPADLPTTDGLTNDWPTPYASYRQAELDLLPRFRYPSNVCYFLESLTETEQGYDFLFSRRAMGAVGIYQEDWFHLLPKIQCPTLLVQGGDQRDSELTDEVAEKMASMLPNCTIRKVTDAGHMVYADNPDAFYPVLDEFLTSLK